MSKLKAYIPINGQQYQILRKKFGERFYEHCDYAKDKVEEICLIAKYRKIYHNTIFKTVKLPKKYWKNNKENYL